MEVMTLQKSKIINQKKNNKWSSRWCYFLPRFPFFTISVHAILDSPSVLYISNVFSTSLVSNVSALFFIMPMDALTTDSSSLSSIACSHARIPPRNHSQNILSSLFILPRYYNITRYNNIAVSISIPLYLYRFQVCLVEWKKSIKRQWISIRTCGLNGSDMLSIRLDPPGQLERKHR